MLSIMFSSDCLCLFGLFNDFPLSYMISLGVFVLKRLTTLSLELPTVLFIGSGILFVNQLYQVFLLFI